MNKNKVKDKTRILGVLSVIFSLSYFGVPLFSVFLSLIVKLPDIVDTILMSFALVLPLAGFLIAFICKLKYKSQPERMKLFNVGAVLGLLFVTVLVWLSISSLLIELFSVNKMAAEVTATVDTILITGSLGAAYFRGKIFWFI